MRLVVSDDLERSRLTVFFRLLLAIPHLLWLFLWSIAVFFVAIVNWFATLFRGRPAEGLHRFLASYVRYATHLYAYLLLAANPYPGFAGDPGTYPVDLEIDPAEPQSRLKTAFRLLLAIPALVLTAMLVGGPPGGGGGNRAGTDDGGAGWTTFFAYGGVGIAFTAAIFGWFAIIATGRMPLGFRNLAAWSLRYAAQTYAYLLLVTERYPDSDPLDPVTPGDPPAQAVRLVLSDDGRRSRLTVFFRLLLAFPHFVWLLLWGIAVVVAAIVNWVATLALGRSPEAFHRFLGAYLRYQLHVGSFATLVANPFPGFTGAAGRYPVDLEIDPPERQHRLKTLFRIFLALPAILLTSALSSALVVVAFFGWFAALATGRMPTGFRNAGAYVLRYSAQTYAYGYYLLTDRYPFSGPRTERAPASEADAEEDAPPALGGEGAAASPA